MCSGTAASDDTSAATAACWNGAHLCGCHSYYDTRVSAFFYTQSVTQRATCSHPQGQASTNNLPPLPSLGQHTLVCLLVLGMAMASALWVPNIEFIFGLTGATASVLIAYILPAIVFIRLLGASPELDGSGKATMVSGRWQQGGTASECWCCCWLY